MAIFLLHKNKFDLICLYFLCRNLYNALLSALEISQPHPTPALKLLIFKPWGVGEILAIISWHLVKIVHKRDI